MRNGQIRKKLHPEAAAHALDNIGKVRTGQGVFIAPPVPDFLHDADSFQYFQLLADDRLRIAEQLRKLHHPKAVVAKGVDNLDPHGIAESLEHLRSLIELLFVEVVRHGVYLLARKSIVI